MILNLALCRDLFIVNPVLPTFAVDDSEMRTLSTNDLQFFGHDFPSQNISSNMAAYYDAVPPIGTAMSRSLPYEVFKVIIQNVLVELVRMMQTFVEPISIIADYRALLLSCTTFKRIIEESRPRYYLKDKPCSFARRYQISDDESDEDDDSSTTDESETDSSEFKIGWACVLEEDASDEEQDFPEASNSTRQWPPEDFPIPDIKPALSESISSQDEPFLRTTWRDIFQVYQKVMVGAWNREESRRLGKFWLNPQVDIRDLANMVVSGTAAKAGSLLLLLHDAFQRTPIPLESNMRLKLETWAMRFGCLLSHPFFDLENARYCIRTNGTLTSSRPHEFIFSVSEWAMRDDPHLSAQLIAPEVKDWWFWHRSQNCYEMWLISGYSNGKAWVIWRYWDTVKVYLNFEPKRPICGVLTFNTTEGGYQDYWFGTRKLKWSVVETWCPSCHKYTQLNNIFRKVATLQQSILRNSKA